MPKKVRVVFGGDTAYGESYQANYAAKGGRNILAERGYGHCSEKLAPLLRRADHVILNLETPLSARRETAVEGKTYVHWADPEKSVSALKALNVHAVSLANNHAGDLGVAGLLDTFEVLEEAEIAAFGGGGNAAEAVRAHEVSLDLDGAQLKVAVLGAFNVDEKFQELDLYARADKPGVAALDFDALQAEIDRVRASAPDTYVVAFPHWGFNYVGRSDDQTRMADKLLELGVDLILGHGAHRLQEIERRNGSWVAFGLGNFVFNAGGRYAKYKSTPLSLAAELGAELIDGEIRMELRLYPIYSDNRVTDYQPRFVTDGEFSMLLNALKDLTKSSSAAADMSGGFDEIGWYVHLPLPPRILTAT